VLDASVALAWCFEDEAGGLADRVLESMSAAEAVVPAIWPVEVANALLAAERRRRITPAGLAQCLALLRRLRILVDEAGLDMDEIVALGRSFRVAAYDAAYLSLALRAGLPLATLDRALTQAARHAGIPILDS
jgi:predicted nucleic acid-binding protein